MSLVDGPTGLGTASARLGLTGSAFGLRSRSYTHVPFQRTQQGGAVRIVGTVPALCSDFKIDRPSFLAVAIKNEIPVRVDMTWQKQ